jgi:hypothetical protein
MGTQCGYGGATGVGINTDNSVSYLTDPQAGYPSVGDRYLMRILVGVVGPSCDGGLSDFNTELLLPASTALAVDLGSSNPDDRVRCFYQGSSGQVSDVTNQTWSHPEKPQISGKLCDATKVPVMGQYGYGLGFRIAPMGGMFWVDVPVVTYRALNGMAGAGNTTKMGAAISSGLNSFVNPTQWVTVFDRAASVSYPADSTTAVTDTTVRTKSVLNAWYRKGDVYVDLGTGAAGDYQVSAGPFAIDGNAATYTVTQDWAQLTPGTQHHWRLRFVAEGGATTVGEAKAFTTTGTAPAAPPAGGGGARAARSRAAPACRRACGRRPGARRSPSGTGGSGSRA